MTTYMSALQGSSINYAEFVRITTPERAYTFCNAGAPITVDGIEFEDLRGLIGISEVVRNIKSNSADLKIVINGIDPEYVSLVLGNIIKGSKLEIWRGFLDTNNQIITTPAQQFFKRYTGIVNNVAIDESYNIMARQRIATCSISSSSIRFILENRQAGMITNKQTWQKVYPGDTSMNRVAVIASTYFDFGKTPIGGSQAVATVL